MILIEDVSKIYHLRRGSHVVLNKINLCVEKGQKIGIVGHNGAGKSTLIRLIGGAESPSSGRVERRMSVSWPLAFNGGFQSNVTGFDNLRFICRVYGVKYRDVIPFVEDFTELGRFLNEPVVHYSDGMRARLAFALSMAIEFDCFLIDETIAVGDSRFHDKCRTELFDKRKDRAMIIVSHQAAVIKEHCQHAAVLVGGKLHSFGDIDEAYGFYAAGAA